MKLIYRTRGNSTPQGKPRVYFTGHPLDLPAYREDIFADILQTQNCAIYYDEDEVSDADREDLLRELEQMQLIVIPVTSRFLYQPNRALDLEFPFAMEHHIPVLPLMQEQDLEAAFNEKCGDLQMLNKNDPDPTALPYREKLEKFLSSVLVGDELAEKVRAAFDAYVFLSYRKKDRKYAQELMRLIHKNDFCRDIAIWYDEFLTPGENFNEAIAEALNKCSLFTLAVTPNVVEPGNYVMSLEYPEAKKSGKPILPVELVPTDREVLHSSFEDIPPCADAHDEPALSAALLAAVQKLAIRENDGSPEHNFFIGLAYLNGIDVEVDRSRAISLITGAAQSGLPEAMEKLVGMYRSGDGVKRDYRAAIGWQERLVDFRREQFEESGAENSGLDLARELWNLGDYQEEIADLPAAGQVYERMRSVCEELNVQYGSEMIKRYLSISYSSLGDISRAEGRLAEAKDYYLQTLGLFRQLAGEVRTAYSRSDLSISYERLGNISRVEGRLAEAKEYYLQSLKLRRQLAEETGTVEERRGLSISYDNLGDIGRAEGRLTEAKDCYLRSLKLRRELVEETETVEDRRNLLVSYTNLGKISEAEGRLTEAKEYYLQSLELDKQLAQETGTVQAQLDVAVGCTILGDISKVEGGLAEAKDYYLQSMGIFKKIVEETGTVESRRSLSITCERLGDISQKEGRLAEAKDYYLQNMEITGQLVQETGTVQARRSLSISYDRLGDIGKAEGRLSEAKDYYQKSLEMTRQIVEETGTVQARRSLSISYYGMGNISKAEGRLSEAKDYYLQSLDILRQLVKETDTAQARQDFEFVSGQLEALDSDEV